MPESVSASPKHNCQCCNQEQSQDTATHSYAYFPVCQGCGPGRHCHCDGTMEFTHLLMLLIYMQRGLNTAAVGQTFAVMLTCMTTSTTPLCKQSHNLGSSDTCLLTHISMRHHIRASCTRKTSPRPEQSPDDNHPMCWQ